MKNERTYLDIAKENLMVAKTIYNAYDDESMLNYTGYHLQQAVELSLKYLLFINGIDFPKVHSINQLISIFEENNMFDYIPNYIDDNSDMLTNWESMTRYIVNYQIARRKIEKAIPVIEQFLIDVEEISNQNQYEVEDELGL